MKNKEFAVTLVFLLMFACLSVSAVGVPPESAEANADSLIARARRLQELGDAESSLSLLSQALEIRSFTPGTTLDQWAEVVNLQAVSYAMKYDWLKAIKTCYNAYRLIIQNLRSPQYAVSLYNLATFYAGRGGGKDYEKAILYAQTALEKLDRRSPTYFECLNNIVYYYLVSGDADHALDMLQRAIQSGEEAFADDKQKYAKALWSRTKAASELESYTAAIQYGRAAINVMEQNGMATAADYVRRLVSVAGYYYQTRDFAGEIDMLLKALPVSQTVFGATSSQYVDCLRKLALAYNHLANDHRAGHNKKAHDDYREQGEHYESLARDILIQTGQLGEIRPYQIPLISNKANTLFEQGKADEAIQYEQVAYKLYGMNGNQLERARSANSLSYFHYDSRNLVEALRYGQTATEIYDQIDRATRDKGLAYSNMSLYCHDAGRTDDAIRYSLQSIKTLEQTGDTLSDVFIKALGNMGVYYHEAGRDHEAQAFSARSAALQNARFAAAQRGDTVVVRRGGFLRRRKEIIVRPSASAPQVDNSTVTVQWNRTVYAQTPGEVHDAYSKTIDLQRRVFLATFPPITPAERQSEWEQRAFIFDYAETLAFAYPEADSILCDAYNAILLRQAMPRYIQQLDSTGICRTWQQLADSLPSDEILVTFFCTPTDNRGDAYSALLLRRGWASPRQVHQLFTDYDLSFLQYGDSLQAFSDALQTAEGRAAISADPRFARMLWGRVLDALGPEFHGTIVCDVFGKARERLFARLSPVRLTIDPDTPLSAKYTVREP